MTKRMLTIEEVISIPSFSNLSIHSSGERVAFIQQDTDWEQNRYIGHVWLYDAVVGDLYPLTTGTRSSSLPVFSPDSQSRSLAYLCETEPGKEKQIYLSSSGRGEGVPLTEEKEGVSWFRFAPDGKSIYYLAAREKSEARKKRDQNYGDLAYIDHDRQIDTIYVLPLEAALDHALLRYRLPSDLRQDKVEGQPYSSVISVDKVAQPILPSVHWHVQSFAISPDGTRILYSAVPSPSPEDSHKRALYLLTRATGESKTLTFDETLEGQPFFSPDGKAICYGRLLGEGRFFDLTTLEIMDLETGAVHRPLHEVDEDITIVAWTKEGIVWEWQNRMVGRIELWRHELQTRELLWGDETTSAHSATVTPDGKHMALLKSTFVSPAEVYLGEKKLTNRSQYYADKRVSRKQSIHWNSKDGQVIEGVLTLPDDFSPENSYPLLVVIHGGPAGVSYPVPTANRYYPIEQFVEKGCIVLEPNYRGSAGYGAAFRRLNVRQLGLGDYADVITGVDHLIALGYADRNRVGVMGWSQGGYISAFCSTYSERFKAISVGAGISNWLTYYVNTDIHPFTRHYLGDTPWVDPGIYAQTSPMTYIRQACTPTLIQHGDQDKRVPVPNAFELYQGLLDAKVDTKLVLYNGMGHGSTKPGWNRAIMAQNLAWFAHYLLGESLAPFWLGESEE